MPNRLGTRYRAEVAGKVVDFSKSIRLVVRLTMLSTCAYSSRGGVTNAGARPPCTAAPTPSAPKMAAYSSAVAVACIPHTPHLTL